MGSDILNPEARQENIRALILAAGLTEEEATLRLKETVLITWNKYDQVSSMLVEEIKPILGRTLEITENVSETSSIAAELIIGQMEPQMKGRHVYVSLQSDRLIVSAKPTGKIMCRPQFPLFTLIAACYVTGSVIYRAVGDGLTNPPSKNYEINFNNFIASNIDLNLPINIQECYLAGAGAIGNGFLWAARYVNLQGKINVSDDDIISSGNLQRQIWFENEDLEKEKVAVLCKKAQGHFPDCVLVPSTARLQNHPNRTDGPWLKRLIVAVDSRRARRHLQNELPGEVFDASTTGSEEIVLHYNKQPTNLACMGCIYFLDQMEIDREQIIAEHLGIDPEIIRRERIDKDIANEICAHHPQLNISDINGLAFDTLYKQLCSSGQLNSSSGKQVVAPFAFVSVLAGALLLVQLIQSITPRQVISFNDWRISPWRPPILEMKQLRPSNPNCQICARREIQALNKQFWRV